MPLSQTDTATKRPNRAPRPATPKQRLLSLRQGSEESGWPTRTLYGLIVAGDLPFVQLPNARKIWIERSELEALIARSKAKRAAVK